MPSQKQSLITLQLNQTFNYAIYANYTKHVNFKFYSINVTVVNILFINKSPEE